MAEGLQVWLKDGLRDGEGVQENDTPWDSVDEGASDGDALALWETEEVTVCVVDIDAEEEPVGV